MNKNQLVYQLFTGRIKRANILDHPQTVLKRMIDWNWDTYKQNGFNTIYLLGLFDSSGPIVVEYEEGMDIRDRKNRVASIFALSNQKAVNPILGNLEELKKLVNKIRASELKVWVDFVPNHTALNHPWIVNHPEYYQYNDGNLIREFSGDVAKLNYENKDLRQEMIDVLLWISSLGIDGIRCDMAHLVPNSFWNEAITTVKSKYNQIGFAGEAYADSLFNLNPLYQLLDAGFDCLYNEPLYRNLKMAIRENKPEYLDGFLDYFKNKMPTDKFISYIANHDDSFPGEEQDLHKYLDLLKNLPGSKLFYNGLLKGRLKRLAHHYVEILEDKYDEGMGV